MLHISEQFYSIQGEGSTVGIPSVFLRLKGCNLTCGGKRTLQTKACDSGATWRCDTMEVWTKGEAMSFAQICKGWENKGWLKALKQGAHLILTGGEPLLYQTNIKEFITFFKHTYKFIPPIEIETNGTFSLDPDLTSFVFQCNVSPKLSNSGVDKKKRINSEALSQFSRMSNSIFKFVVSTIQDIQEIEDSFISPYHIQKSKVYLMPAAASRDELKTVSRDVIEWCKQDGYRYSTRLHIDVWDQKTGV